MARKTGPFGTTSASRRDQAAASARLNKAREALAAREAALEDLYIPPAGHPGAAASTSPAGTQPSAPQPVQPATEPTSFVAPHPASGVQPAALPDPAAPGQDTSAGSPTFGSGELHSPFPVGAVNLPAAPDQFGKTIRTWGEVAAESEPAPETAVDRKDMSVRAHVIDGALIAVVTVAVMAGIGRGGPVFDHGIDLMKLLSGLSVAGLGVVMLRSWRHRHGRTRRRYHRVSLVVSGLLLLCFVVGASNSVVIDGRPYLNSSVEARTYRELNNMFSDLERIAAIHDEFIKPDDASVRSRLTEMEAAVTELAAMNQRYSKMAGSIGSLPDAKFAPIVSAFVITTDNAWSAARLKADNIVQFDQRRATQINALQSALVENFTTIGPALVEIESSYGFVISPSEANPGTFE